MDDSKVILCDAALEVLRSHAEEWVESQEDLEGNITAALIRHYAANSDEPLIDVDEVADKVVEAMDEDEYHSRIDAIRERLHDLAVMEEFEVRYREEAMKMLAAKNL